MWLNLYYQSQQFYIIFVNPRRKRYFFARHLFETKLPIPEIHLPTYCKLFSSIGQMVYNASDRIFEFTLGR